MGGTIQGPLKEGERACHTLYGLCHSAGFHVGRQQALGKKVSIYERRKSVEEKKKWHGQVTWGLLIQLL